MFGAIFTLGFSEISRATIGNTNHWAFIARASAPGWEDRYFLADFGQGAVIPTLNQLRSGLQEFRDNQILSGTVLESLSDTVKLMNTNENDMDTWVVRPKYTGDWEYAYNAQRYKKYAAPTDLPWKKLKNPMTLEALTNVITAVGERRGTDYHYNTNNCQHFAEDMFNLCV